MEKEYPFTKMVEFMKVSFKKIKKVVLEFRYILMEIYILAIFLEIKSMAKVLYIGLVYANLHKNYCSFIKFNNIMDNGGVAFQMEKDNIWKLMVNIFIHLGDHYVGIFKNGLKHGDGVENYGNGDKYEG